MDTKTLKQLQKAHKESVSVEEAAHKKRDDVQVQLDALREQVNLIREELDKTNKTDPDNFAAHAAGKITDVQREHFVFARKDAIDQLRELEPRLGSLAAMVERLSREHVAAGQKVQGARFDLWHYVKDSLIEELRHDSRTRMIQVCVALGKAGAQYAWPYTNNVFTQVYGTQVSHDEFVAVAEELDRQFL